VLCARVTSQYLHEEELPYKPTSNDINAVIVEHTEWQQANTECTDIQEVCPKNLRSGQHNKGNEAQGCS